MNNEIEYVVCPGCGEQATKETIFATNEIKYKCNNCNWKGEEVPKLLKFTCPECGGHELESIEDAIINLPITLIRGNGDLEYENVYVEGDSNISHYSCPDCNFILKNKREEKINDVLDLVDWVKENCKQ